MRYATSCQRRAMGEGRPAVIAGAEAREERRSPAGVESPRADRHLVRAAHGAALAAVALGAGLRERLHLLATLPDLDATRRVATTSRRAPARLGMGRRDRLESGRHRQLNGGGQKGGDVIGPNPRDKGRAGCKRHLVVDAKGIPLAVRLTAANVHDSQLFEELLDAIPPLKRRGPGRPQRRPKKLHADKGYDYRKCRAACWACGIAPRIARRGIESKERLGRHRWVIERAFAPPDKSQTSRVQSPHNRGTPEGQRGPLGAVDCVDRLRTIFLRSIHERQYADGTARLPAGARYSLKPM